MLSSDHIISLSPSILSLSTMAPPLAPTRSNPPTKPKPNLFINKKKNARPLASTSSSAAGPSAPPILRALGKQRSAPERSASPAIPLSGVNETDLTGRPYEDYDIVSLGIPPAMELTNGVNLGADFNVIRLYQLNSSQPVPNLANPEAEVYFNRQNPNDRPFAAPLLDAEKEAKRLAREAAKKPIQNGPNGEWRVPMMDRDNVHQVDQRTGEKMWRVVQDPTLVAPEARKAEKKEGGGGGRGFERKRRGGGGGGRGRDDRAKVFARSGNFKDGEESARNHQELNREKLPLVIQGAFPNPEYRPNEPDRTDSRGQVIPATVEQKWVGKHQQTESEAWAALMFENGAGGQRVTLKVIDREYKFEPHRHINVPTTSYDAGQLVSTNALARDGADDKGRCCNIWKARTPCRDSHSTTQNPNPSPILHPLNFQLLHPRPRPQKQTPTPSPSSVTRATATRTFSHGCLRPSGDAQSIVRAAQGH